MPRAKTKASRKRSEAKAQEILRAMKKETKPHIIDEKAIREFRRRFK